MSPPPRPLPGKGWEPWKQPGPAVLPALAASSHGGELGHGAGRDTERLGSEAERGEEEEVGKESGDCSGARRWR